VTKLTPERRHAWQQFFENARALIDRLDSTFERDYGIPPQWYDVLVHLEESPDGLRMNVLAERILYSKSGLTRVIDRMEQAGLVRRYRPDNDRRSIFVLQTPDGRQAMEHARPLIHAWIEQNFSRPLTDTDIKALTRAFEKLSSHTRTHRPGRDNA
jgi:DNA-binding MarR family transcriptional regulator